MSTLRLVEKEEKEERMSEFKLITGGKEPPNEFWLKDLKKGAVFLSRPKQSGVERYFVIAQYTVAFVTGKGYYYLMETLNAPANSLAPILIVDPVRFSNRWELLEVMDDGSLDKKLEEETKEETRDD